MIIFRLRCPVHAGVSDGHIKTLLCLFPCFLLFPKLLLFQNHYPSLHPGGRTHQFSVWILLHNITHWGSPHDGQASLAWWF